MRSIFFLHVYYKMTRYISKTTQQTNKQKTNKQTKIKTKQKTKPPPKKKNQKTRERLLILIINGYCTQQSWSLIMPGMESARYLQ